VTAPLEENHLSALQSACETLIQNGSGTGICGCGVGDNVITTLEPFSETKPPFIDSFQVSYYDVNTSAFVSDAGYGGPGFSGGSGDNTVHIVNPVGRFGTLCAMIYVFDDNEEMLDCCGCPISPDGMRTLSVINDLTSNFGVGRAKVGAGTIDIVSSTFNFDPGFPPPGPVPLGTNTVCSPTGLDSNDPFGRTFPVNPVPALRSWIEHDENLETFNFRF
jgi:hypothetical protein